MVSHLTAAQLWGMWDDVDDLDVSVRYPRRVAYPGVRVHRSSDLCRRGITRIDDLPVTTPVRTLIDLGLVLPESEVRRLVHHELATDGVTRGELWQARIRLSERGRNGAGVLGNVLRELPDLAEQAESGPEIELLRILKRYEVPTPVLQHPVRLGGHTYRLDFAYPVPRVAIEFDGFREHTSPDQFVHDRRRQNALILAGWTVLRFTWADLVADPGRIVAEITFALPDL